jgi:hypothetical protein
MLRKKDATYQLQLILVVVRSDVSNRPLDPATPDRSYATSSPMASTTQKATIVLDSSKVWYDWLEEVKSQACAGKVWDYVDPSKTADEVQNLSNQRCRSRLTSSKV